MSLYSYKAQERRNSDIPVPVLVSRYVHIFEDMESKSVKMQCPPKALYLDWNSTKYRVNYYA
jgi:hypothetical protein